MESCDSIALEGWFGSGQCGEEKLGYCQVDGSEDSCSRETLFWHSSVRSNCGLQMNGWDSI